MTHHILIIEDDPDIQNVIRDALERSGHRTTSAPNAISGLTLARQLNPDLILLDLGLPDFDGAEVARRLRKNSSVPIIIVSAQDALHRKLNLLGCGANDYLTKPFHDDELRARVNVQLRRREAGDVLQVSELTLQLKTRQCTLHGVNVHLTPKEFDLLVLLASHPGRVFHRDEINRGMWQEGQPNSRNLMDVHLANLRKKLRTAGGYGVIRTFHGVGFALRVQEMAAPEARA